MAKDKICTQDIVDVEEIKDGIIKTKDGRYIKVVELEPINFHLRSEKEKNEIIFSFASYLKIAPVKIQFKVLTRPANIDNFVNILSNDIKNEKNEKCRELQQDYLQLICNVGLKEGVTRQFFIIVEYSTRVGQSNNYDEIRYHLATAVKTIENYMRRCGNKIVEHEDEDIFLCELLYTLYNRVNYESLHERMLDVIKDYSQSEEKKDKEIEIKDLLAPRFIHLDKQYIILNDTYYTFMYIPANSYKHDVVAGWLAGIINAGAGIDVDLFLEKQDKTKIRNKLGQQLRINMARIKDTQDTNQDFDDLSNAIASGYFIKESLANNEDFYYMNTIITISGQSQEEIDYKVNAIQDMLASQDLEGKVCKYHMIEALRSIMPLCNIHPAIKSRGSRNVLTYGAASTYIFTAFEMTDDNGILFGVNQQNNSLCIIDLFNTEKYKNANVSILGTSGAGKTFLLQTMALRMRMKNIQTFIIAPLKGHEFRRACKSVGGSYIKISPGSSNSINILEIRPVDTFATELLDGEDAATSDSILSKKIQNLHTFFSLIIPDMNYEEVQLLDNALIKTYEKKGITHDNDSLIDKSKPMNGKLPTYKEMPILEDVYNELRAMKSDKANRIATILDRYVHGSASSFNRQTNVDLSNRYVVIDISDFNDELQAVGMFVALDYVYDKVKEDRTKRKAVFIDEAWKLIGSKSNALAANFVLEVFKIIRGYGGAAIAATQDINDFFALNDGKYGKGIISNSKTKIILQLESSEAEHVQEIFELSDRETMNITRFERGNGLIITNSNNIPVRFTASLLEEELITTDRQRLETILEQKKKALKDIKKSSND